MGRSAGAQDSMTGELPLSPAMFFVLFALAEGDKHGYRIMQDVAVLSSGAVAMGPATLYTTLQRLVDKGYVVEVASTEDSRRRVYRLSKTGGALLDAEFRRQAEVLALARRRKVFVPGGAR